MDASLNVEGGIHFVLGQYRMILSAAAVGAVLKPQGGNCAVLP